RWFLLGGVVAFVLFLPHLVWQITHNFPTLEWQNNVVAQNKNVQLSPVEFFLQQILMVHPLTFPIWLLGLYGFFFSDFAKEFRAFGWAYIFLFLIFIALGAKAKAYYLTPFYPVLLGGGAVAISSFILRRERYSWVRPTLMSVLIIGGAYTAPLVLPILPEETFIEYSKLVPVSNSAGEHHRMGKLPQQYADMHGWEELAADVAKVYRSLPEGEQKKCAIFGQNYGEAGAIDLFGRKYNLPKAISGHQNYYFWGPREYTGELVIVIGDSKESLERVFTSVDLAAVHESEYAMPYESNLPIFVCRGLKTSLKDLWPKVKEWI
ncbi:MAG: hypothetical protein HY966_07420, partial [Ignavibacteriales bacterium]|nr:hypothetical protein [Ignavibacteriales bacterium]